MALELQYKQHKNINIDGVEYGINDSFDVLLRLFDLLEDSSLTAEERIDCGLNMIINNKLNDCDYKAKSRILKEIIEFYVSAKEDIKYDINGNIMPNINEGKFMDYNKDASLIYAAFMQQYGIDLIEMQGRLSWNQFKALMDGLTEDTKFIQVIQIRRWKPGDDNKTKSQVMSELQEMYSLGGDING